MALLINTLSSVRQNRLRKDLMKSIVKAYPYCKMKLWDDKNELSNNMKDLGYDVGSYELNLISKELLAQFMYQFCGDFNASIAITYYLSAIIKMVDEGVGSNFIKTVNKNVIIDRIAALSDLINDLYLNNREEFMKLPLYVFVLRQSIILYIHDDIKDLRAEPRFDSLLFKFSICDNRIRQFKKSEKQKISEIAAKLK